MTPNTPPSNAPPVVTRKELRQLFPMADEQYARTVKYQLAQAMLKVIFADAPVFGEALVNGGDYHPVKPHRPPTVQEIVNHLNGKSKILLVYPFQGVDRDLVPWVVWDLDAAKGQDVAFAQAVKIYDHLSSLLLHPKMEFSGTGYHVWMLFQDLVPAKEAKKFGDEVLVTLSLPKDIEIFPKQNKAGKTGNGVKLPCGQSLKKKNVGDNRSWFLVRDENNEWVPASAKILIDSVLFERDNFVTSQIGARPGLPIPPEAVDPGLVPPLPVTDPTSTDGPTPLNFERSGIKPGEPAEAGVIVLKETTDEWSQAVWWLHLLDPTRAHDYDQWLHVGFALHEFGDQGLLAWDNWSQLSGKYEPGTCAEKWEGMEDLPGGEGITHLSLKFWAIEDKGDQFELPAAPKYKKPSDYQRAMETAGWEFRLNEADYDITFMGISLSGPLQSVLNTRLREYGYTSMAVAHDVMGAMAFHNSYHPIKDYLDGLTWDGKDHIGKLATYFTDKHDVFGKWLRYWLIGAVARLYEDNSRGTQNRMLVLDGKQNIGKSYFVRWLTWQIPAAGYEGPINPEDKDNDIRLMRSWVWEVSELGSTVRKADREALKAFISKQVVDVRKPYDKRPVRRPAISSFIGTLNNETGFLEDPTGHRRFMVATLTDVNWSYAKDINVGQLWAQACALYQRGEAWELSDEDRLMSEELCSKYERTDVLEEYILQYFTIDESRGDWFTPTVEILEKLQANEKIKSVTDRGSQMRVSQILTKYGLDQSRVVSGGVRQRGFRGVLSRNVPERGLI